jgi:DNA-binding MarR family transcriptional regulator
MEVGAVVTEEYCAELLAQLGGASQVIRSVKRQFPSQGPHSAFFLLAALRRHNGLRIGELAELFDVDLSVVSRQVADLEGRGWVVRTADPHDRRSRCVQITAEGRCTIEELRLRTSHLLAEVLAQWSDEDVATLSGLLARLRTSFEARRIHTAHPHTAAPHDAA